MIVSDKVSSLQTLACPLMSNHYILSKLNLFPQRNCQTKKPNQATKIFFVEMTKSKTQTKFEWFKYQETKILNATHYSLAKPLVEEFTLEFLLVNVIILDIALFFDEFTMLRVFIFACILIFEIINTQHTSSVL